MKKILLVAAIALFGLTANAQEKKESKGLEGTWWVSGQLQFGSSKDAVGNKTSSTTVLPIVGTFISPDVTIGLGIGNIGSKYTPVSGTSTTGNLFVVKPLVRKYWNISGGLYFYGQAAVPMTFGKDAVKTKTTSVSLDLAPGFDYVINKWMTVETSFNLVSIGATTSTPDGGTKSSTFGFNAQPMNTLSDRALGDLMVGVKFLF